MPVTAPAQTAVRGLPMQVRLALRDDYGKENTPLWRAVDGLEKDIGRDVALRIDWNEAWSVAQAHFKDDAGSFVPRVMDAARDFVTSIQAAIEADDDWGMTLLKEMERGNGRKEGGLGVKVVIDANAKEAQPYWDPIEVSVVLRLPPNPAGHEFYYPAGSLKDAIRHLWEQDEPWVDAGLPDRPSAAGAGASGPSANAPAYGGGTLERERMPKLGDIPRPAALGETMVPYWATIFWSRTKLEVYGTHPPTIDLMIAYMRKHMAVNPNTTNKQTFAKLEEVDNALGTGKTGVWLELRSNWGPEPNAMMPLQFLQGALGYRVERTTGNMWVLRRDVPFAP